MDSAATVELIVEGVTGRRAMTASEAAQVRRTVRRNNRLMRGVVVVLSALIGTVSLSTIFLATKDPGAALIFFLLCVPILTLLAFGISRQSTHVPADYALIRLARCEVLFGEPTSRRNPVYLAGARAVTMDPEMALRWPKDEMALVVACPVFGGGHPFPDVVLLFYAVSGDDSGAVAAASKALVSLTPRASTDSLI